MKKTPILFSGEMVRAILDGRKTITRRVIKPQPPLDEFGNLDCGRILGPGMYHPAIIGKNGDSEPGDPVFGAYDENGEWGVKSPYGRPGDLLWVRETWATHLLMNGDKPSEFTEKQQALRLWFRADQKIHEDGQGKWRPSIFMPRWASRITLRVTAVRVERVQDISEADAVAEGIEPKDPNHVVGARYRFAQLWNSINAKRGYGWDVNPWCWVVEFETAIAEEAS